MKVRYVKYESSEENWEVFFLVRRFMCCYLFITGEPVWPFGIAVSYRSDVPGFEIQQEQEIFP